MVAQSVNKIGFGRRFERGDVHRMYSSPISLFFSSNQHVPLKTYNYVLDHAVWPKYAPRRLIPRVKLIPKLDMDG